MIGVVSDMHLREERGYADCVPDRREGEKEEVLDSIVNLFSECDTVVLLGDMLNARNNPSSVIREYVEFLERLGDRKLYIMAGNHEKFANGSSAIDFLRELKGKPNWTVITDGPVGHGKLTFLPYMHRSELGTSSWEEATEKVTEELSSIGGDILFAHHALAGTETQTGDKVDLFNEVVLPLKNLTGKFSLIIGGHIHKPQQKDNAYVVGSVFADEVDEGQKYVLKIDEETMKVTRAELPGRRIIRLLNPTGEEAVQKEGTIVRAVLDRRRSSEEMDRLKDWLQAFDAYVLVESYASPRKRTRQEEGFECLPMERMLKEYAKSKDIDGNMLLEGWDIIKE